MVLYITSYIVVCILWLAWSVSMAIERATTKAKIRNLEQRVEELENEVYEDDEQSS